MKVKIVFKGLGIWFVYSLVLKQSRLDSMFEGCALSATASLPALLFELLYSLQY